MLNRITGADIEEAVKTQIVKNTIPNESLNQRIFHFAQVISNQDPQNLNRIKCRLSFLDDVYYVGKTKEEGDKDLPWCIPFSNRFLDVPEVNAIIMVAVFDSKVPHFGRMYFDVFTEFFDSEYFEKLKPEETLLSNWELVEDIFGIKIIGKPKSIPNLNDKVTTSAISTPTISTPKVNSNSTVSPINQKIDSLKKKRQSKLDLKFKRPSSTSVSKTVVSKPPSDLSRNTYTVNNKDGDNSRNINYKAGIRGKGNNRIVLGKDYIELMQNYKDSENETKIVITNDIDISSSDKINILSNKGKGDVYGPVFDDQLFEYLSATNQVLKKIVTLLNTIPAVSTSGPCMPGPSANGLISELKTLSLKFAKFKKEGSSELISIN